MTTKRGEVKTTDSGHDDRPFYIQKDKGIGKKKAKILIISFSGEINTDSSLEPDNGLMSIASQYIRAGHQVKILDYGVVDTIRKLHLGEKSLELRTLGQEVMADLRLGKIVSDEKIRYLRELKKNLEFLEEKKIRGLGKNEILPIISSYDPDLTAFKVWNGSGFTGFKIFSEMIKTADPYKKIVGAGPHSDWWKEHLLAAVPHADVTVFGEGEPVAIPLLQWALEDLDISKVPNTIYRDGKGFKPTLEQRVENLDDLSMVEAMDPEVYPALFNNQKYLAFTVESARGCVHNCSFCIQPIKSGNNYRKKSPKKFFDEVEFIQKKFGTTVIRDGASNTLSSHARSLAEEGIRRGTKINGSMFAELQGFNYETLKIMKEAGIAESIFFGLESGSPYIRQKAFNKHFSNKDAIRILNDANSLGIYTIASLIFPAPFETDETRKETMDFIALSKPKSTPIVPPAVLYGVEWYTDQEKHNIRVHDDYVSRFMNYPIKLFYPGILWPEMPWDVNGKSSPVFLKEHSMLVQDFERMGQETLVSDELYQIYNMVSRTTGESVRQWKERSQDDFIGGNYDNKKRDIIIFNENAKRVVR